jgi:hypothetical protein
VISVAGSSSGLPKASAGVENRQPLLFTLMDASRYGVRLLPLGTPGCAALVRFVVVIVVIVVMVGGRLGLWPEIIRHDL